jgi:hypothetical protein
LEGTPQLSDSQQKVRLKKWTLKRSDLVLMGGDELVEFPEQWENCMESAGQGRSMRKKMRKVKIIVM